MQSREKNIKNKKQLTTINKLTKEKFKVLLAEKAIRYKTKKYKYAFDKRENIKKEIGPNFKPIFTTLPLEKYIPTDSKNRIINIDLYPKLIPKEFYKRND